MSGPKPRSIPHHRVRLRFALLSTSGLIVTRCSQGGEGNALALEFASKGFRVFATARSQKTLPNLREKGIECLLMPHPIFGLTDASRMTSTPSDRAIPLTLSSVRFSSQSQDFNRTWFQRLPAFGYDAYTLPLT